MKYLLNNYIWAFFYLNFLIYLLYTLKKFKRNPKGVLEGGPISKQDPKFYTSHLILPLYSYIKFFISLTLSDWVFRSRKIEKNLIKIQNVPLWTGLSDGWSHFLLKKWMTKKRSGIIMNKYRIISLKKYKQKSKYFLIC